MINEGIFQYFIKKLYRGEEIDRKSFGVDLDLYGIRDCRDIFGTFNHSNANDLHNKNFKW
jgi:hypothetical protein